MREPLNPTEPPEVQAMLAPVWSVMLMMVLLKLALMCAWPCATFLRSRRRTLLLLPPDCGCCCCSCLAIPYFLTFFFPAIATRRPLRPLALV